MIDKEIKELLSETKKKIDLYEKEKEKTRKYIKEKITEMMRTWAKETQGLPKMEIEIYEDNGFFFYILFGVEKVFWKSLKGYGELDMNSINIITLIKLFKYMISEDCKRKIKNVIENLCDTIVTKYEDAKREIIIDILDTTWQIV